MPWKYHPQIDKILVVTRVWQQHWWSLIVLYADGLGILGSWAAQILKETYLLFCFLTRHSDMFILWICYLRLSKHSFSDMWSDWSVVIKDILQVAEQRVWYCCELSSGTILITCDHHWLIAVQIPICCKQEFWNVNYEVWMLTLYQPLHRLKQKRQKGYWN